MPSCDQIWMKKAKTFIASLFAWNCYYKYKYCNCISFLSTVRIRFRNGCTGCRVDTVSRALEIRWELCSINCHSYPKLDVMSGVPRRPGCSLAITWIWIDDECPAFNNLSGYRAKKIADALKTHPLRLVTDNCNIYLMPSILYYISVDDNAYYCRPTHLTKLRRSAIQPIVRRNKHTAAPVVSISSHIPSSLWISNKRII